MNGLVRWWQGLEGRERMFVSVGALVVALVIVYVALWEPAAAGIHKLKADLPQLRAQAASMQSMADEAARLRAAAGNAVTTAPADRTAAVRRSLERAGLWSSGGAAAPVAAAAQPVRTLSVGGAVTTTVAASPSVRTSPPEITADGDRVRVRFDDVDYGVWVGWLASAEIELAARAARVSVSSTAPKGPVGHVKAEALLDWTQPSGTPRS